MDRLYCPGSAGYIIQKNVGETAGCQPARIAVITAVHSLEYLHNGIVWGVLGFCRPDPDAARPACFCTMP